MKENNFKAATLEELCANADANKALLKILADYGKANGLKGFENVKAIKLVSDPFTPENNLMSPTFKLKRHEVTKKYKEDLDAMYAQLNKSE